MHADATARNPQVHPSSQNHKGMELRISAGVYQPPSHQLQPSAKRPILPRDSPQPTKAAKEGGDGRIHLFPSLCTVSQSLNNKLVVSLKAHRSSGLGEESVGVTNRKGGSRT
jgi:hypothetical protein